jgi:type IV pilus assembly protein PilB
MPISDGIRELTLQRAAADQIAAVAVSDGMRTLRQDGFEKVRLGLTSVDEVVRVVGT